MLYLPILFPDMYSFMDFHVNDSKFKKTAYFIYLRQNFFGENHFIQVENQKTVFRVNILFEENVS